MPPFYPRIFQFKIHSVVCSDSIQYMELPVYPTGGPGSGKGTQCSKIVEEFGYVHLSAGDLLRQEVARASERGQMIEDLMKEGKLVPQVILLFLHNGS